MKAIIFDWDGTIIKSKKANFHAFKKLHDELNLNSVFTMKEFVEWYSPNWYMIYEKMGIPEEEWPCMHACLSARLEPVSCLASQTRCRLDLKHWDYFRRRSS